jgi:hypothetical protein
MPDACGTSYKIVGPYNQTLFLGCSVTNINMSLGWGAEASTLTVSLVEDKAYHPQSNVYDYTDNYLATKTNPANVKNPDGYDQQIVQSGVDRINATYGANSASDPSKGTQIDGMISQSLIIDTGNGNSIEDQAKTLQKTIALNLVDQENTRDAQNLVLNANNETPDFGKVAYSPLGNKKYWKGKDPGFLGLPPDPVTGFNLGNGLALDLIGTPVVFRFDDLTFGGMIHSWKVTGAQGGWATYEVEIRSFSSLLNGCQLIIDGYAGAIAGLVPGTQITDRSPIINRLSVPHSYIRNQPNDTATPNEYLDWTGDVRQGNLPNVFNIFGLLESVGFGNSMKNDNGIRAIDILRGLQALVGGGAWGDSETYSWPENLWKTDEFDGSITNKNPFSPYGAIVGRRLSRTDGTPVQPHDKDIYIQLNTDKLYLEDMGLCRNRVAVDNQIRSLFKLDLSEVPVPPNSLYMQGPTISLMQFITELCDGAGYDFYVDFVPDTLSNKRGASQLFSGIIKVRTVSRRSQPPKDIIKNVISYLTSERLKLNQFNYGQEFTDNNIRSIYIGGKQKRLLQVRSIVLSSKQSTMVFDPYVNNGQGNFIQYESLGAPGANQVRQPCVFSTRRNPFRYEGGCAVAESRTIGTTSFGNFMDETTFSPTAASFPLLTKDNGMQNAVTNLINKGNYFDGVNTVSQMGYSGSASAAGINYALYSENISPYFGKGANGLGRKVYFDPHLGQTQIVFQIKDLDGIFKAPIPDTLENYSPQFIVLENEIRCAGKGFQQWFEYAFCGYFTTDISEIIYRVFKQQYGAAAKYSYLGGLNLVGSIIGMKTHDIANGAPATRGNVSLDSCAPYVKDLYGVLEAVFKFFANIATEYYGKQYMIKVPTPRYYLDRSSITSIPMALTGEGEGVSVSIYIGQGTGKLYSEWTVSEDGAWEEPGNWIDDRLIVGSTLVNTMVDDQGKIPPIIGFNSSAEIDYRKLWEAEWNLYLSSQFVPFDGAIHTETDFQTVCRERSFNINLTDIGNAYPSINHKLPHEEFISMPINGPASVGKKTAHGFNDIPPTMVSKTYAKATAEKDLIFLSPNNTEARIIMTVSSPVFMGNNRNYTDSTIRDTINQDMILRLARGATIPSEFRDPTTSMVYSKTIHGGLDIKMMYRDVRLTDMIWGYYILHNALRFTAAPQESPNDSYSQMRILNKAAIPCFAAIPIEFSQAIYGPWINHPGIVENYIFNGRTYPHHDVNNLVGGTKVNVDESLVPWNYGSTEYLDNAVMSRIKDDVNYQQVTEQGTIGIPGMFLVGPNGIGYGLGDALQFTAGVNGGPIINNIQVQVGEQGVTTTYNMRTYTRKLGFFNKDNAERIKQIGQESLKRRKEISQGISKIASVMSVGTNYSAYVNPNDLFAAIGDMESREPKIRRWSPFEVLAGSALPVVHPSGMINSLYENLGFSPFWYKTPHNGTGINYTPKDMVRYDTNIGLYDKDELPKEFTSNYSHKSFMSLDGIFSPISFYPTLNGTTYSITKYPTDKCAFCNGTKQFKYDIPVPPDATSDPEPGSLTGDTPPPLTLSQVSTSKESITVVCPFCETASVKSEKSNKNVKNKEVNPPYILASGDDFTLLQNNSLTSGIGTLINYSTLNPILMSGTGEFSNSINRQSDDHTGHSISLVGMGLTTPEGLNGLRPSCSDNIDRNYLDYDLNWKEFHKDREDNIDNLITPSTNMRFFGFRGPLMLHGWGYDTEGFPVPNSCYEPKVEDNKIVLDNDGNVIYKNQTRKADGTWTKPFKENTFLKGWGQLPGSWPVGPIDLRWDEDARVWTVGANYKSVWIVIENDLVGLSPTRGIIVDDSYSNNPLPTGIRKMVFVKDSLGLNSAPRGAAIYCKYDSQNGFYEPIYNMPHVTSGVISSDNSVNLYKVYTNPKNSDIVKLVPDRYETTYNNPLEFDVSSGDKGMFVFIGGKWTLQSYRC